jgi:NAD(P)-dependent dehydrogenase (short-subunit alcohol dehydrogenase family)
VGGLLVAGALAVWVPPEFGQSFFAVDHPPLAGQGGSIIVTASISGKGHAGLGIYSATKTAIRNLGRTWCWKGRGIRVNATQEPSRTRSERLGSVRWRHSGGS